MTGVVVEFIILLVAHAAAGIYSSTLKYSRKTTYTIWGAWIAAQTALLFYTEFVLSNEVLQFLVGFLLSLVGQYVIFFVTTKGRIAQRMFTMLTYSVFFCIAMTSFLITQGSLRGMHWVLLTLIQLLLLVPVLVYFLCYVCPLCRAASRNITKGWFSLIFVNVVFIITIILSSIFPVRLTSFSDPSTIAFIFLSISIMTVYPVIFSSINHMSEAAEKREVEAQNELLVAQIEAENVQLAADSQARHDRRHHNLVMLEFANNNDIESVREYLNSLVDSDSVARSEARYCENMTVNTVLTVYERRAKEKGISVNIKADVSRDISIAPRDLVIVIANVFENAINAVSNQRGSEGYINITVRDSAKRLLIIVDNPTRDRLTFDEDSYGIGIRSVISTVKKYEGMYDFIVNDGVFSAKISLNL